MSTICTYFCLFGNAYAYKLQIQNLGGPHHGGKGRAGLQYLPIPVYQFLSGSLYNVHCTSLLSFSHWPTLFFSRRLKLPFSLFENMKSLKNINILVAENSLYVLYNVSSVNGVIRIGENTICLSLPQSGTVLRTIYSCRTWKLLQRVGLDWY
jgi:hypothetical protein